MIAGPRHCGVGVLAGTDARCVWSSLCRLAIPVESRGAGGLPDVPRGWDPRCAAAMAVGCSQAALMKGSASYAHTGPCGPRRPLLGWRARLYRGGRRNPGDRPLLCRQGEPLASPGADHVFFRRATWMSYHSMPSWAPLIRPRWGERTCALLCPASRCCRLSRTCRDADAF